MKVFRYVFGVFALAFGFLATCACLNLLASADPRAPWWAVLLTIFLLGFGPLAAGYRSLIPFTRIPTPSCPTCGNLTPRSMTALRKSPLFRIWLFGCLGVLFSVWLGGKPKRFHCGSCDETFRADSRGAAIARIFFWLVIAFAVLCVLILCVDSLAHHPG